MLERSLRRVVTASLSPRMAASASRESAGAANDAAAPSSDTMVRLPRKLYWRILGLPPTAHCRELSVLGEIDWYLTMPGCPRQAWMRRSRQSRNVAFSTLDTWQPSE